MANLTYLDFAQDELKYLARAYNDGYRYGPMVSQAQRITEMYMKQLIEKKLMNNNDVMVSHNLRKLYDYITDMGVDLTPVRADIMLLNNFYTHTRYPGRESYIATAQDVEQAFTALQKIVSFFKGFW